jgi:hypothetical protein
MIKTTVRLSPEVKAALTALARQRQVSEARIIRDAIAAAVGVHHPRPTGALYSAPPFAENADQLLAGFGQR